MSLQRDQKKKTWPSCISGFVQFITMMKGMTAIEEVYHQRARKIIQVMIAASSIKEELLKWTENIGLERF